MAVTMPELRKSITDALRRGRKKWMRLTPPNDAGLHNVQADFIIDVLKKIALENRQQEPADGQR